MKDAERGSSPRSPLDDADRKAADLGTALRRAGRRRPNPDAREIAADDAGGSALAEEPSS